MLNVIFIHRKDPMNTGDIMSCPANLMEDNENLKIYDILDPDIINICKDKNIILGGGGLISSFFLPALNKIIENSKNIYSWGIGINTPTIRSLNSDIRGLEIPYSDIKKLVSTFKISSLRDNCNINGSLHVPCVSCMHPAFLNPEFEKITNEVILFNHRRLEIFNHNNLPCLTNMASFTEIIKFLKSSKIIITSSYHGAYWGLLLGREVWTIPWSAKFLNIDKKINIIEYSQINNIAYKNYLDVSRSFYNECRLKNLQFAELLKKYVEIPNFKIF